MKCSFPVHVSFQPCVPGLFCAGPRLFLSAPMDISGCRLWFMDLWNYSIVPYMLEAVREGLQVTVRIFLKYQPVIHHCVVILFWSSGIMDCLLLFWKQISAHALALSVVWHLSITIDEHLQLNQGCFSPMQYMPPESFPFNSENLCFKSLLYNYNEYIYMSVLYVLS